MQASILARPSTAQRARSASLSEPGTLIKSRLRRRGACGTHPFVSALCLRPRWGAHRGVGHCQLAQAGALAAQGYKPAGTVSMGPFSRPPTLLPFVFVYSAWGCFVLSALVLSIALQAPRLYSSNTMRAGYIAALLLSSLAVRAAPAAVQERDCECSAR